MGVEKSGLEAWLPEKDLPFGLDRNAPVRRLQTRRHFSFALWGMYIDVLTVPGWHWDHIPYGFSRDRNGLTWAWPHRTGRSVFVVDVSYERLS